MSRPTGLHALTRSMHEKRVLTALRTGGAMSRAELSERVGLSRTTVSEITGDLLARGAIIVAETDAAVRVGSGRPAELLCLDPSSGQFLGVDFGHRRVQVAVADAGHEIIAGSVSRYADGTPWDERLEIAFALTERLAAETGTHLGALQAVGIGVPGPYVGNQPGVPEVSWNRSLAPRGVDTAFAERFGAPVIVDNNTRFAALAEAISHKSPVSDLVYVRLSDGVGGGLVVAGRLVTGGRGYAGELGHVTADPNGATCRCGKRGCLETVASTPAILRACRERGASVASTDDLADAVTRRDPAVEAVLRDVGSTLGRVLGAAAMVLNPDEVVIGGEIVHVAPVIVEQAAATLRFELFSIPAGEPVVVRAGQLRDSDGAVGAIAALFHQSPLLAEYAEAVAPAGSSSKRRSTS